MKKKKIQNDNMNNFFNAMSYELAGDIGVIDNEEMINNSKLITGKKSDDRNQLER